MTKVSFIGIGNMGEPMAANVAKAGFDLLVYDADLAKAGKFAERVSAKVAASLAEAAQCDFCVVMLPTSDIVQDVLIRAEAGAFLNNATQSLVVIDMSSSDPQKTRETGAILQERGVAMIDAPVSGGVVRAESGTLAIMIGSDDHEAVQRAEPVLKAMGKQLFRVGKLGAGDVMKAANNFIAAATYAATAEAISVGKRFGLDPKTMIDIINVSTGRSFNSEIVFKDHVVTGRYSSGFALALLTKDVGIARKIAADLNIEAPVIEVVSDRYKVADGKRGAGSDNSEAIIGWYEGLWEKQ